MLFPTYLEEGRLLAAFANDYFGTAKTAAILYQNDDTGKSALQGFKSAFRGRVVAEQAYEAAATDITSQMANLRSANPDILFMLATPPQAARAYAYMQLNNWKPQVILSQSTLPGLLAAVIGGGNVAKGYRVLAGTITSVYLLDVQADSSHPAMVQHKRIMNSYGGPAPSLNTVLGQTVAELTVEVLRRACDRGDLTRAGVLRAAQSLKDFRPSLLDADITITLGPDDPYAIQKLRFAVINADGSVSKVGPVVSTER